MTNRREFLGLSAGAVLGAATIGYGHQVRAAVGHGSPAPPALLTEGRPSVELAQKPLSILMLGGTGFLGPQTVEAALKRGHKVTLFNRGKTRPGLFPDLEKLHGDREKTT